MENNKYDKLNILFIKQGNIEVGLLPELGGTIAFAKFDNIDFMRPWNGELTPRRTCCYPLVPFSNRIANGRFSYRNQDYQLAKNFGDHPHTIHGVAWQKPWQAIEHLANKVTLFYEHTPQLSGDWPFAFTVTQQFEIVDDSLLVSMTIENKEAFTTPIGFGWHPFFPRHDGVSLQFNADKVVLNNDLMLPEKVSDISHDWDFSQIKPLGEPKLDNCFVNWQHNALIKWQHLTLSLTASDILSHLVVMTPPNGHFFAVEPVSHINNAINSADPEKQGIHFLTSGKTLSGWMRLHVQRI